MEASNIIEGEKVQIVNINNGERLETYVIKGERNKEEICLNGPAARKVQKGDELSLLLMRFWNLRRLNHSSQS